MEDHSALKRLSDKLNDLLSQHEIYKSEILKLKRELTQLSGEVHSGLPADHHSPAPEKMVVPVQKPLSLYQLSKQK